MGSSLKDLEKAFGKPDQVDETDGPITTCASYYKLGLEFTLYSDNVVSLFMSAVRPAADESKAGEAK